MCDWPAQKTKEIGIIEPQRSSRRASYSHSHFEKMDMLHSTTLARVTKPSAECGIRSIETVLIKKKQQQFWPDTAVLLKVI